MQEQTTTKVVVFGEELRKLMADNHLTQTRLAEIFGVSQTAVWKWLKNTIPSGDKASEIANHFGISVDQLLYGLRVSSTARKDAAKGTRLSKKSFDESGAITDDGIREGYRKFFRDIIRRTAIEVSKRDIKNGYVDLNEIELTNEDAERLFSYPIRVERLDPDRALELANDADFEPEDLISEALSKQFPDELDRNEFIESLSHFSQLAVLRASLILSLGPKLAHEMLTAVGYGNYLAQLEPPSREGRQLKK